MKSKLVMIGGGGHCLACADIVELEARFEIVGIVDRTDTENKIGDKYPFLGMDERIPEFVKDGYKFLVTVGQIKSSRIRERLFQKVVSHGGHLPVVISPQAYVSPLAKIGQGSIVMHRAVVNAVCVIGENCIINTGVIVEHGVMIGSHCHISTGAILNGDVRVGDSTFVGSQAMVSQGVQIGGGSVIGAGINLFENTQAQTFLKGNKN